MDFKGAKSLSMEKAVEIISTSKGKIMNALFEKVNGKDRIMQFRYLKNQKVTGTGCIKITSFPDGKIRTLNIQKLKGLKANKQTFKLKFGQVRRVKKVELVQDQLN